MNTRRLLPAKARTAAALLLATAMLCSAVHAQTRMPRQSLASPLHLADEGSFFVGGKTITTNFVDAPASAAPARGKVMVNQMYVHYRIPAPRSHPPIVMVHGGGLTGQTFETTPDGREGWATYFARQGFPVYVVDFPGRGRAGFDPTGVNQAKVQKDLLLVPEMRRTTEEFAWTIFRFGPAYGETYPGLQFPTGSMEGFNAQGVPYTETTLQGGANQTAPVALLELLQQTGPAILLVHSQAGPFADAVVGMAPQLVTAVVNVEGNHLIVPTDQQVAGYRQVPALELFGDNLQGNTSFTGQARLDGRKAVAARINAGGGSAQVVQLPEAGIRGNSHMVMQDRNNLQVADFIIEWLKQAVRK